MRKSKATDEQQQRVEPSVPLPKPCDKCAALGGNWVHSERHSAHLGAPVNYSMAGRCNCTRGRKLAEMDRERVEHPRTVPAGAAIDAHVAAEAYSATIERWKKEHDEELTLGPDEARRLRWERNAAPGEIACDKRGRTEVGESNEIWN